jgi:hypothetical protein
MAMKTLIKIVKCLGGYELHYRVEGQGKIEIRWISKAGGN